MNVKRRPPNRRPGYSKEYYWRDPERGREAVSAWRKRNPGKGHEKELAWKKANRARLQKLQNEWRKRTGKHKIYFHNRRAKQLAAGTCDPASANALTQIVQSLPKMKCALCGKNMKHGDRTIDHVIPISKGGTGHIGNLQIVHGSCNASKSAKFPHELDGQLQIHLAGSMAA